MDFSFMIIIAEGTIAVNSFPSFYFDVFHARLVKANLKMYTFLQKIFKL